jgi:hypothetical protein
MSLYRDETQFIISRKMRDSDKTRCVLTLEEKHMAAWLACLVQRSMKQRPPQRAIATSEKGENHPE